MTRCLDLARRGIGRVSPNPPVGAVLVHEGKILSEGYHRQFGGPHAEVNAIHHVAEHQRHLIPHSTLYVSLEPCCTTGKTGPCTNLIISEGIREVRISTSDPNPEVAGRGVQQLRSNGVQVVEGILKEEGEALIRPFTTNILYKRPHVLLKWAQSMYGYSGIEGEQIWLSETDSKIWSHSQRASVDAIMVGARTVETDNPSLTTRNYPGRSPQRVIYDPGSRLHKGYKVFADDGVLIHYYSLSPNEAIAGGHIRQIQLLHQEQALTQIMEDLFGQHIGILLIEGGPFLQKQFIKQNLWDEAWVIRTQHALNSGITSPNVYGELIKKEIAGKDTILGILNKKQ